MSKMKKVKNSAVLDQNNDHYDPDTNLNTGKQKAVVMKGGKPVAIDETYNEEYDEENEKTEIDKMIDNSMKVKMNKLPDMLKPEEVEKEIPTKKVLKTNTKVRRIKE